MVSTFPSKLHRKVSRRRRRKTRREIFFSVNNFYNSFLFFGIFLCELTSLFFRFSSSPTPADSALLFSLLIRHDPTCVCICDALSLLLFVLLFSLIASTLFHLGSVCILSWHKFPDLSRLFSYLLCNYANMRDDIFFCSRRQRERNLGFLVIFFVVNHSVANTHKKPARRQIVLESFLSMKCNNIRRRYLLGCFLKFLQRRPSPPSRRI